MGELVLLSIVCERSCCHEAASRISLLCFESSWIVSVGLPKDKVILQCV